MFYDFINEDVYNNLFVKTSYSNCDYTFRDSISEKSAKLILAGVKKEDINIEMEDSIIKIEFKLNGKTHNKSVLAPKNTKTVSSNYENGVLTLEFIKNEKSTQKIEIE